MNQTRCKCKSERGSGLCMGSGAWDSQQATPQGTCDDKKKLLHKELFIFNDNVDYSLHHMIHKLTVYK